MLKTLIIDDEQKARNVLNHYLKNAVRQEIEARHAESVEEALKVLEDYQPDIVFLDVEMPHQNGFEFLLARKNPPYDIVFTTAFNQYAIQAIRFSALDYLLKPVDPEELQAAVDRHLEKVNGAKQETQQLYENLVHNIEKKNVRDFRLAVPTSEGVFFFTLDEILRLEADKNYTSIHLVGKRPFLASKTLKHFDEMLGEFNFIRTHKSHLVNPKYIKQVTHNNQFLLLSDGSRIEISRRKKELVQQYLKLK
ncbi:DNA-binding response regulator [Dyadobacter beijingensis]|uniref:DNA-binding response regulator n=1 Tax=Dyadobacter beijingensis TaxID=365489 RepID=A0ABQ2HQ36_9BACT|nr:LytTR family DNA-binding domain-containing protein [Dyadobacter beijingensis]GGM86914.1 DNA-binding response regulator [Dyadobacter beijingensis]